MVSYLVTLQMHLLQLVLHSNLFHIPKKAINYRIYIWATTSKPFLPESIYLLRNCHYILQNNQYKMSKSIALQKENSRRNKRFQTSMFEKLYSFARKLSGFLRRPCRKDIGYSRKQDVHDFAGFTISSWASFTKSIIPLYQQAFLIMIIVYVNYEIK